jgi:hypothetical protein
MTETRTVILAEDGSTVSIGRASFPTDAELAAASDAMRTAGLGAWLVTLHGNPHAKRAPRLSGV